MAPLIRRLDRSGLYSQTIYNFSIRVFPAKIDSARLATSISQSSRSTPTHGGTFDSPPHGSQILYFDGADPIAARPACESTLERTCAQDAARRPQQREQKKTPASGEKLGPGAAKIAENGVCISFEATDKRCSMGRANSRSTKRFASSQRRLLAGAFYSHIFCSVACTAPYLSCDLQAYFQADVFHQRAVRSSARLPDRSGLAGIKRSPIKSPEPSSIAIFLNSVTWHIRQARWKEIDSVCSTDEGIWSWRMKRIPRRPTVST